jgi:hypothetical protein
MARLALIVTIFIAAIARCGQSQSDGGYVAPELSRPTPGHLLDQDYLTSTAAARRSPVVG